MLPSIAAPFSDGTGNPLPGSATEEKLRRKVTNLGVGKRASALVLQMESTARDACVAMGSDKLMEPDAVGRSLRVPREYFAPNALNAVYQYAICFLHFERTTHSTDAYLG